MRKNSFFLAAVAVISMVLTGCKAKVDFKNIDKHAELEFGLALPIGSVKASMGDFLKDSTVKSIFVDENGIYFFRDTFKVTRDYHEMDLSKYISTANKSFNVYDKLKDKPFMVDHKVTGDGNPIEIIFPLTLKLDGINKNTDNERLDSASIENASFTSVIKPEGGLPLQWEWIDRVEMHLGPQFTRDAGNILTIYKKGDAGDYYDSIPIPVDEFRINLMKDKNPATWQKYLNNTIDSCDFAIHFVFTIPNGQTVTVPESSAFGYYLGVRFIDHHAIWGYFEPSSYMRDTACYNLAKEWSTWKYFQSATLPVADPKIDILATTQITGAMVFKGDYLYTETSAGERVYATFGSDMEHTFEQAVTNWLDLKDPIGTEKTYTINFDKSDNQGRIDRLFNIRPDYLGYCFNVRIDPTKSPQIRITPNTKIRLNAVATIPFRFHEGLALSYRDTITKIDITKAQLDSLMAENDILDTLQAANAKIFMSTYSTLPVRARATVRALDADGKTIMDPADNSRPWRIFTGDTLSIMPAVYTKQGGTWVAQPGETIEVISVDKEHYDVITRMRSLIYEVSLDDKPHYDAWKGGMNDIRITTDQTLKVKLGLTANIKAVVDLNKTTNK